MLSPSHTLTPALLDALTYWPGVVGGTRGEPPDISVLAPFFDELLAELPWWNRAWRVTSVEPAHPREVAHNDVRGLVRCTEVCVPGTVSAESSALPLFARVRFEGDRLVAFQAKIGGILLTPASTPADQPEPHPFGAVLTTLMDTRGIGIKEMAMHSGRAMTTIHGLRTGWLNPNPVFVREIAAALGMAEADIAAIAGLT
ncbi:MAG: XRE family transcriptional regulator [Hamadaea sp.]|uniref:hypothetical protein n=1 Tax=Hamadaea sp. TaxID=2024425 RepID=UPI0017C9649C|nr:hypothetical protein [Hamadaea sp.]NUT22573.1 XRE family transcriptional regulator [Hamadaea sp.]